jgi:hypothetical protein
MKSLTPSFKSSAFRAYQKVFESSNWFMNVVWLSVAVLAHAVYVGQIALFGWGADQLEMRSGRPTNPTPDIDANRLGEYLGRGIWPFCVYFVVQIAAGLFIALPIGLFAMMLIAAAGIGKGAPTLLIAVVPLILFAVAAMNVLMVPFLIRSMACQSFQQSFDLAWVRQFVGLMFWEVLFSGLRFMLLSFGVSLLGMLTCIGYIPALGIVSGAAMNMLAQWYEIFQDRGGEPVPMLAPNQSSYQPIVDAEIVSSNFDQ